MRRGNSGLFLAFLGLGLTVGVANAAEPGVAELPLERLELNPGAAGSLLLGTGELLPQGELRISTVGQYQNKPIVMTRIGEVNRIVGHRVSAHLAAAYSPWDWLELGAQVPLVAHQGGDDLSGRGFVRPPVYGLSTPVLGVRWGPLSQRNGRWADVALGVGVGLPFGEASGLSSDAGGHVTPQLMLGRRFGWFRVALDTQVLLRKKLSALPNPVFEQAQVGSEVRIGAVAATVGRRLRWELDVRGTVPLADRQNEAQGDSVEFLLGSRYLVNHSMEVFALGGMGIGAALGTPLFRLMVGTAFGSVTPPRLPGESSVNCSTDLEHTAEECPSMDEDQDGVLNGVDRCPYEAGTLERNGCLRRDLDGDGIEDALDACPSEVGAAAWNGCPMPDDDQDGVPNDVDSCPAEAGPPEARGCAKKDRDHDEIEDDVDQCPDQPGEAKLQGCPESDRDGDTIANRFDSCPDAAGKEENHGCPDHELPLVTLSRARFELTGKVLFVPAQPILDPASRSLLDWVVKVIQEHPEFPLIVVGAHTDNRGFASANLQLSQARAVAVRQYLIQKGVAPERLEARGYGDTRPIDNPSTSMGRENNRRVEFHIIWPD
ncbi:OmpA family protein [Stigmatella sp. ncwal1]|uniref:OmpA family protein n=1 Tax=Stigmatella ashevillensis TaxID=2995309 RepID=A0ABT5DDE5_9BACT|nr:OmpA family protein [Stigmatella ashevillena]MDC0711170.1 OmpA family protein [Stigmatella ashevillena]